MEWLRFNQGPFLEESFTFLSGNPKVVNPFAKKRAFFKGKPNPKNLKEFKASQGRKSF